MFVRILWDSPKKHPNENFQLLRVKSEIIRGARVRLILMSSTFRIAHLYRYTQNISGHPQKLIWCLQFGVHLLLRDVSFVQYTPMLQFFNIF